MVFASIATFIVCRRTHKEYQRNVSIPPFLATISIYLPLAFKRYFQFVCTVGIHRFSFVAGWTLVLLTYFSPICRQFSIVSLLSFSPPPLSFASNYLILCLWNHTFHNIACGSLIRMKSETSLNHCEAFGSCRYYHYKRLARFHSLLFIIITTKYNIKQTLNCHTFGIISSSTMQIHLPLYFAKSVFSCITKWNQMHSVSHFSSARPNECYPICAHDSRSFNSPLITRRQLFCSLLH